MWHSSVHIKLAYAVITIILASPIYSASSASFIDIYLKIDINGQLSTRLYDKREDFNVATLIFHTLHQPLPHI